MLYMQTTLAKAFDTKCGSCCATLTSRAHGPHTCEPRVHYESTGEEAFSGDRRDAKARSRRIFAFHKPKNFHAWLKEPDTLRARLGHLPPLDTAGLRDCQIDAVNGLDVSLAQDKPRALIQMSTGASKTFTACTFSWRLLKFAKERRILFLVDRNNLCDQTLKEYQNYDPPGSVCKFDKTYIVQHLQNNRFDPDVKVVITISTAEWSVAGRSLSALYLFMSRCYWIAYEDFGGVRCVDDFLLCNVALHLVHRVRLMLLSRMGIAKNHVDLRVAKHCRKCDQIDSGLRGPGRSGVATVIRTKWNHVAAPYSAHGRFECLALGGPSRPRMGTGKFHVVRLPTLARRRLTIAAPGCYSLQLLG